MAATIGTAIRHEIVKPHLGARVHATRADMADRDFAAACLDLLEQRNVLVFPEIGLSDEEQIAFTDLLGERVDFTGLRKAGGDDAYPDEGDIYRVSLDKGAGFRPEFVLATLFWHMDGITAGIIPPKATLLSARVLSAKGGQTEFANTFAAYEALPDSEKEEIANLRGVFSTFAGVRPVLDFSVTPDQWSEHAKGQEHPLVWKHADGRKSLIIGTQAESVVGMDLAEGRALLARLLDWAVQPDFTYRHEWRIGDLVIWNNTGSLHRVIPYDAASGRSMHRTSLAGTEPIR
ncbi:MAG: TauD/TfdA family dioxygenase [Novosphingobium sp.]|nr:TauD/TfdA family dioxygenase [Novosphingobium sp.]